MSLWRQRHSLRYFAAIMYQPTLHRSIAPAALLAFTLSAGASLNAIAADSGSRDVQVNLDALDSLGPAPAASASGTGEIHLHPPRPKIKATPAVAPTPQPPARAAATAAAATTTPPGAGNESPAASAPPPPPAATPAPVALPRASVMTGPPPATRPPATPAAAPSTPPPPPTRLLFAAGASDLPDGAKPKLDAVAQWLDANLQARIQVVAYAAGSAEQANDARRTSLSRALAVRSYLAERGVATIRMEVRALGNHSAEGEPLDRVDILMMER
jgi:outer membrane protein OmpA-like peptidoglycan-associated protein